MGFFGGYGGAANLGPPIAAMLRALGAQTYARHLWDSNPRGETPSA